MSHGPIKKRTDEDEEVDEGPPPPDGGWGWVVAFASFMIHIVTDGVTYSFGVFYDQFLEYFQEGKARTSWILSILVGVTLCSGPISSAFVNKFGCRPVTIAGSILAAICLFISVYAENVTTLYFTVGIGTGLGFGLIYLPAIVSVTTYFEKKRSLATGIAVCGSGLGTFIFAPLIDYLVAEYGWRGSMMIVSAIVLKCIFFGAMFRPLVYEKPKKESNVKYTKENGCVLKNSIDKPMLNGSAHDIKTEEFTKSDNNIQRPVSMGQVSLTVSLKLPLEKNGNIPKNQLKYNGNDHQTARMAQSTPLLMTTTPHEFSRFGSQSLRRPGPLNRKDVFYQGSLMNIPQYKSRSDLKADDIHTMERSYSSHSHRRRDISRTEDEEEEQKYCFCLNEDTKETLNEMFDFSLFKDPIFVLFTLSNFCTSIGFNVPYVYLVSKAKSINITATDASLLLSVIGIANTLGRIVLGYISDKPWVNRLWVYNCCLTICGIATVLSAFCMDFISLCVYSSIFGFTIGAYVGLTSVILVDLLGLDKLTNAFGLLLLFQGIASLIGPPIAGALYDAYLTYDPGFAVAGVMVAASGLMLFAIPSLQRYMKNREEARRRNFTEIHS